MVDSIQTDDKGRFDDRYLLIRPLSTDGATADVWLALDLNTVADLDADILDRISRMSDDEIEKVGLMVAIKIYRPENALDIEGEQRFREEYMIVFNCHHANLIHPVNFSIYKDTPYLVLPYCKQGSSELLIGNKFSNDEIWKYVYDVASGLAYLHALKPPIVHQDVKPANILIDDTGHYALTDFGISAQYDGGHEHYSEENSGTMAYMAPERFKGDAEPTAESDIWSLGATLCEILTGKVPFGEGGGNSQAGARLPMPSIPNVHTDLQRLVHDCLALDPAARPTARQIAEAARARQYPIKSRKLLWGALAALLLIVVGAGIFFRPNPTPPPPMPPEVLFDKAIFLMDSCNDLDSLNKGLYVLDSLIAQKYVPAMYEKALTYGWSQKGEIIARKQLLGIKTNAKNMPTDEENNQKSVTLLDEIINLSDSNYALINGRAASLRATYEYNPDSCNFKKGNVQKAKEFLNIAELWAKKAGDQKTLEYVINEKEKLSNYQ